MEDKEGKAERDRIKNAKRAEQQRARRAKVMGLALGRCLRFSLGTNANLDPNPSYNTKSRRQS